jgi:DNA-binding HxlR family transcriptional regulator
LTTNQIDSTVHISGPHLENTKVSQRELAAVLADIAAIIGVASEDISKHPAAVAALRIVREMAEDGADRSEPVRTILIRIGDRWTPLLVQLLEPGPLRFSQLRKMVGTILNEEISKQILSGKLHALERDGFVRRVDLGGARPAVEYSLTPIGLDFCVHIKQLITWARAIIPVVRTSRDSYRE